MKHLFDTNTGRLALGGSLAILAPLALGVALHAQAPATVPSPCDFTTSGGYVITDAGKKANFGVHGGCKNGEFWGHVNYMDHNTGYHVDSVAITGYLEPIPGAPVRDICGIANTNGNEPQPVFFRIRLTDNGEPGTNDQFGIRLSNGYLVTSRTLSQTKPGGGDVQLHEPNASTTAPEAVSDEFTMCNGVAAPVVGAPGGGGPPE